MQKELLLDILAQNQLTCSIAFKKINHENISLRLNGQAASVGFIYRHIGETINLFGRFFGLQVDVQNTTMGQQDTGQNYDLDTSREMIEKGYETIHQYILDIPDSAWLDPISTPFFGTVSRVRLFSHFLFHTSHHAGQISLTLSRAVQ